MAARGPLFSPEIKRLVDTVDRGPEDDLFYPAASNNTLFRREWPAYHNATPETVEIGYQGNAAWGGRIVIPLTPKECGDLLSWVAIRLQPQSWLGPEIEAKLASGSWNYTDVSGAWMWANSLGSIAIASVELQINEVTIEQWPGEWMDVWSRMMLDAGRAPTWDADLYGHLPVWAIRDVGRPPWTTFQPTEDGYVYCWLPLCFLRRTKTPFPLVALGEQTEMRLIVNFRPFSEVVRRRAIPRSAPDHVPLGEELILVNTSGPTPVPWAFTLPTTTPGFEDVTVLAGVIHLEDPLRSAYMRVPMEMCYDAVVHMQFDGPSGLPARPEGSIWNYDATAAATISQRLRLTSLNGPIREVIWFLRRKDAWQYNDWTNYGALGEGELAQTIGLPTASNQYPIPHQLPLLKQITLYGGNAIWRHEEEYWWRADWGLSHRGGVRVAAGMVYGFQFGAGAGWSPDDLQPAMTFNASRADLILDLDVLPLPAGPDSCESGGVADGNSWEVNVFGVSVNWLRFVEGQAAPLFRD